LQDIRTLSGTVDQKKVPHRAFMRIAVLEMERARRGKERDSALHRVRNIEARFREIEEEKEEILRVVGVKKNDQDNAAAASEEKAEPDHSPAARGFKIRY
jgi:CRISPR/Cas system-associated endonuclease Cas3-HD